jgi:glutamate synthase (NADPH/NADH) small chain
MAKRRLNLNRIPIPKQPPSSRIYNFNEVALGYTMEQAREEARRCLQCKDPGCVSECPICVDVPGFISAIEEGDLQKAVKKNLHHSIPGF